MVGKIKVHFGCASHKLADWINVDLNRFCKPDLVADLTKPFPFKSNSVDYIHSEDFLDQIELADAYIFLQESLRILKRDGVMRILTPNLKEFARRYLKGDKELIKLWNREVQIPLKTGTLCEIFNLGIRLLGHRFLYDEPTLAQLLRECGFEPKKVSYNYSEESELRGLDIRSPQTGISIYYDCYKGKKIKGGNELPSFFHLFRWLKRLLRW
jgi:predicted SAM-dependent methyltransferase